MAKTAKESGDGGLHRRAQVGDVAGLALLIAQGAQLNRKDHDGCSAAMEAARNGQVACLEALIEAGAKVATRDGREFSALDYAVKEGHVDCIAALLAPRSKRPGRKVAILDASDAYGHTALMLAVAEKQEGSMRALIQAGADLEVCDEDGDTALAWASGACKGDGWTAGLRMLLGAGADMESQNRAGQTPAMVAAQNNELACLEMLWAAGANLESQSHDGRGIRDIVHADSKILAWLDAIALSGVEREVLSDETQEALDEGSAKPAGSRMRM